jgi:hypothetical protein
LRQPALPPGGAAALDRLIRLNTNRLTPLQALNILAELQSSLERPAPAALFPEETR